MRKLTMIAIAAGLVLLMVAPVSAGPEPSGTPIKIAVPSHVPVDGELNMVVFTGAPKSYVDIDHWFCFDEEPVTYEVRKMVIRDSTSGQAGVVANVVVNEPLKAGARIDLMGHTHYCTIGTAEYLVYEGVVR